jgi:hypothetical protein
MVVVVAGENAAVAQKIIRKKADIFMVSSYLKKWSKFAHC